MNQFTKVGSRRRFILSTATLGASTVLVSHSKPLRAAAPSRNLPPSERVNLAAVGIGNRGESDLQSLVQTGLCNVVALCDVDLDGAHTQRQQKAHPTVKRFTDFRKMFDQVAGEIDAVLIATADHSHFAIASLAMSLGKHVYVEKPLAHTFGDWGPHILDTSHRFLELGLPEKIAAVKRQEANPFVYPQASTIRFGFPRRGKMPACKITWYDGTNNKPEIESEYIETVTSLMKALRRFSLCGIN